MTTIFEYNCVKCGTHRLKSFHETEAEIHEICKNWECPRCGSVVSQWQFVDILFIPNKGQDQERAAKFNNLPFGLEKLVDGQQENKKYFDLSEQVSDKLDTIFGPKQREFDLVNYLKEDNGTS